MDDTNPATQEPTDEFAEALARFDEQLSRGDLSSDFHGNTDSTIEVELGGAQACLRLLERAFPRSGLHSAAEHPECLGRFELVRVLGQGGFGIVYLARDPRLGRLVALKVPRLHTLGNAKLHQRFLREARAAAALDHPNILPILETGEIGPVCYIASAYCDGADLAHWIKSHAPVTPRLAARIVAALADATHYSHGEGILHRDLKPNNVLLAAKTTSVETQDADEMPFVLRLTDFGLAQLVEEELGDTGSTVLGTPLYMAPEQAVGRNDQICAATDVYALGVILYELLTARPPFQGAGFVDVLDQIRSVDPIPPSQLIRSVAKDLETICLKCLRKEINGRYSSAGELRDDLQRYLRSEPILARPASLWDRSLKWAHRHPGFVTTLLVSALSLIALFGGLTAHLYQVEHHLRVTENLRIAGLEREAKLRLQSYASEVEAASNDLNGGAPQQAQARLAQFIPASNDQADLRGLEWNYLWRRSQSVSPVATTLRAKSGLLSIAVDHGSRYIAGGSQRGSVIIWDLHTGQELKTFTAHESEVRAMQFTPDGRYLVTCGCFRLVRVWNVGDWTLAKEFQAHTGTVMTLDINADGTRLLTGGRDSEVRCWDWREAKLLWSQKVAGVVHGVRFAEDGRSAFSIHDDSRLVQWNADSGDVRYAQQLGWAAFKILDMDLPADSRYLVAGGYASEARCYDTRTHLQWSLRTAGVVHSTACSRDGAYAAFGTQVGEIYLLQFPDSNTRQMKCRHWCAHDKHVRDLRFSADGKSLLSVSDDQTLRIWDLHRLGDEEYTFLSEAHIEPLPAIHAISASETLLASANTLKRDGSISLHSIQQQFREVGLLKIPQIPVSRLEFDPQSDRLAALADNEAIAIWDRPTVDTSPRVMKLAGVYACSFSPDGRVLAVGSRQSDNGKSTIDFYDPATGAHLRKLCEIDARLAGLSFAPQGKQLVAGFLASPIYIVDVETGEAKPIEGTEDGAHQFSFNAAGTRLAAGRWGGPDEPVFTRRSANRVFLIDMNTQKVKSTFRHGMAGSHTYSVAMSPDGRLLAVSSDGGNDVIAELILWHVESERIIMRFDRQAWIPSQVTFLRGGEYLAATAYDPGAHRNDGTFLWRLGTSADDGRKSSK